MAGAAPRHPRGRLNDRWLACRACGLCIDAGYRRARAELEEPGIVRRREPVDAAAVERADGYRRGAEESAWLAGLLPAIREIRVGAPQTPPDPRKT